LSVSRQVAVTVFIIGIMFFDDDDDDDHNNNNNNNNNNNKLRLKNIFTITR